MNPLSETQARAALAGLRSETVDEAGVEVALGRLLGDLPRARPPRRPLLVSALGAGALAVAVILVLGLVIGLRSGGAGRTGRPAPVPTLPSTATSIADGLATVNSLVDVDGYLWAAGSHQQGGGAQLVKAQIASRAVSNSILMTTSGTTVGVSHLATFDGKVFAASDDGGVQAYAPDGTPGQTASSKDLGSSAESLAASPTTGLWMLSCCGPAPAAQSLAQQRDPVTLAPLGDARDISPLDDSVLAAGPAGVWLDDADTGLRRIDKPNTTVNGPVLGSGVKSDTFAVGEAGPVVATADQLIAVDARTLALRRAALPIGLPAPSALTVTGTAAYLAFTDRILRYDLTTMTETGSFAVTGTTALTAGPDGVWAATHGRLVRVDTLPVLPPAPTTYKTIPTGLTGIDDLVDVDGQLWASAVPDPAANGGTLSRVEIADGSVHQEKQSPGVLSTDGTLVFFDHGHPGVVDSFNSGGELLTSKKLDAISIAASKPGLSVLSCCDTGRPERAVHWSTEVETTVDP